MIVTCARQTKPKALPLAGRAAAFYDDDMPSRRAILVAYFVLGAYAVCAQATLLREAQVLLLGSELSWGLVLAWWLAGVAAGAWLAGRRARRPIGPAAAYFLILMPLVLDATIRLLRGARALLGVGAGEYVAPEHMLWLSLVAAVPTSLFIGAAFPVASALLDAAGRATHEKARAIGWVYVVEAAGSLAGGALFSFLLAGHAGAIQVAWGGGGLLVASLAGVMPPARRAGRWAALVLGVVMFGIPTLVRPDLDARTIAQRWSSFALGQELVCSADSKYQNIAVGRLEDQFSLYLNGTVAAAWPNPTDAAIEAHLAASEAPQVRRILVLGGGTTGTLKELLRYAPERLDCVTLDRTAFDRVLPCLAPEDREAVRKVKAAGGLHFGDIRRFVKRAAAAPTRYDLVLLAAPEPSSALDARLYTLEFFGELAHILNDRGVLVFSLRGSLGFWSREPAEYVSSILGPLGAVFPERLLTFAYPMQVFAAKRPGVLVDRGEALADRYRGRGVSSPWFDPLWFEGASDFLDPAKRAALAVSLAAHPAAFWNTDERPAAAVYYLRFHLQTTAAAHPGAEAPARQRADPLGAALGLRFHHAVWALAAATALVAVVGLARGRRACRRTALAWALGTTGFASMAIEIILLFTFQTLYGYVYGMIGLVIGIFMAGLVAGSLAMNRRLRRGRDGAGPRPPGLGAVAALDLAVAVFAAAMVLVLGLVRGVEADWPVQVVTFALVGTCGILGGAVFPLAAAVYLADRPGAGGAAGTLFAADHAGACLGAVLMGALIVPVLGVSGACLVVAAAKALSALFTGAAARIRPAARASPVPGPSPSA